MNPLVDRCHYQNNVFTDNLCIWLVSLEQRRAGTVLAGEVDSAATIYSSGERDVYRTTISTLLYSGGAEIVSSGGVASGTVIYTGGTEFVAASGSRIGGVLSGGSDIILASGVASETVISSGIRFRHGHQYSAIDGGGVSIENGGVAWTMLDSGGSVDNTLIDSGGALAVFSSGFASGLTISAAAMRNSFPARPPGTRTSPAAMPRLAARHSTRRSAAAVSNRSAALRSGPLSARAASGGDLRRQGPRRAGRQRRPRRR